MHVGLHSTAFQKGEAATEQTNLKRVFILKQSDWLELLFRSISYPTKHGRNTARLKTSSEHRKYLLQIPATSGWQLVLQTDRMINAAAAHSLSYLGFGVGMSETARPPGRARAWYRSVPAEVFPVLNLGFPICKDLSHRLLKKTQAQIHKQG